MDKLSNSTRSTYRSIRSVDKDIIYIVMYNVGGYGGNESVLDYSEYLVENYNIVVYHQVPKLLETNMLDLGTWITGQSKVENTSAATSNNAMPSPGMSRSHGATWRN